jgi:IclR family acetate operon transcriptional repressor
VQSLTRGLSILECLARTEGGLTLTDIGHRVDLPPSTTHRLLATLEKMGYVYQAGDLGLWYVGLQAFTVGSSFLANRDFATHSHAYMRRLMEQSGETANLAILDGTEAVFIDQVQCRETMRTIVKLGSRVPLHASGVGKAIFASLPDDQIDALLKVKGLPRITENTITSPETMWASVRVIRQRGWSFDDEEHLPGTRCVAAPIYDEHEEPLGAISLAGPSTRLTDERIRQLGPVVSHFAEEITRRLGGHWPHPH